MNKGGCQSERKVVPHDSKSDLPLDQEQKNVISFQNEESRLMSYCLLESNCIFKVGMYVGTYLPYLRMYLSTL